MQYLECHSHLTEEKVKELVHLKRFTNIVWAEVCFRHSLLKKRCSYLCCSVLSIFLR